MRVTILLLSTLYNSILPDEPEMFVKSVDFDSIGPAFLLRDGTWETALATVPSTLARSVSPA